MNKFNYLLSLGTIFTLIACGSGGSVTALPGNDNTTSGSSSLTVTVERGPVFGAIVKDKNDQIARNQNTAKLNTYTFANTPTYPITVTGGYIDVNDDGKIDTNDYKMDTTLSSYSNIVSMLTTYVGNDPKKLDFIKNTYNLSEDDIKNKLPSTISAKAIILANSLYELTKESKTLTNSNITDKYNTLETVYNQSFSGETNLSKLASNLEEEVLKNRLTLNPLNNTEVSTANGAIYADPLALTNSTFTKTNKTSDDVAKIWNLGFDIPKNQDVEDFDIVISILKKSSGTIGNIIIENVDIKDNKLTAGNKVTVFGKRTSGTTSKIVYQETKDITKNAVVLNKLTSDKIYLNLGHIINNQDVVSKSSFTSATEYELTIYFTKLQTNNTKTTKDTNVQIAYDSNFTVPTGSDSIKGTINVN